MQGDIFHSGEKFKSSPTNQNKNKRFELINERSIHPSPPFHPRIQKTHGSGGGGGRRDTHKRRKRKDTSMSETPNPVAPSMEMIKTKEEEEEISILPFEEDGVLGLSNQPCPHHNRLENLTLDCPQFAVDGR